MISLPTPKESAEFSIRKIAIENTRQLFITGHASMRMLEREITDKQLQLCLSQGEMIRGPELDRKSEIGWKCSFRRRCAGSMLRVGCKLIQRDEEIVLILTTFWEE